MEELLDVKQVAKMLGVKPSTIYQWTHQGYIPHVKLNNLVRFRGSKVLEWVEQKSVAGRKTRKVDVEKLGVGQAEKKQYGRTG